MRQVMNIATGTLRRSVQLAIGDFGKTVANLPEIDYCREAAGILEDEAELLRNRQAELEREDE